MIECAQTEAEAVPHVRILHASPLRFARVPPETANNNSECKTEIRGEIAAVLEPKIGFCYIATTKSIGGVESL